MECDVYVFKHLYDDTVLSSGKNKFQEAFERMAKKLTASAPSALKIKVVAPPDGISSWRHTLPSRGSVVSAKLSACGIHVTYFQSNMNAS